LSLLQLRLHIPAFRDVFLDCQKMGDVALLIANRADDRVLPVEFAVLLAVAEFISPFITRLDGPPHVFVLFCRRAARFQDARVLAEGLFVGVSRTFQELVVDIGDATGRVGDHDRHWALLHRGGQAAYQLFAPFALGNLGTQVQV